MKVSVQVELDISAKAVYRDGKLGLSVQGTMPYTGDRSASASVTDGFSEKVKTLFTKAFELLIEEEKEKVIRLTQVASNEALAVAARMGEV